MKARDGPSSLNAPPRSSEFLGDRRAPVGGEHLGRSLWEL